MRPQVSPADVFPPHTNVLCLLSACSLHWTLLSDHPYKFPVCISPSHSPSPRRLHHKNTCMNLHCVGPTSKTKSPCTVSVRTVCPAESVKFFIQPFFLCNLIHHCNWSNMLGLVYFHLSRLFQPQLAGFYTL